MTAPAWRVTIALVALLAYGALTASANALESYLRARREFDSCSRSSLLEKGAHRPAAAGRCRRRRRPRCDRHRLPRRRGHRAFAFDGVRRVRRQHVPFRRSFVRGSRRVARSSLPFALNAASLQPRSSSRHARAPRAVHDERGVVCHRRTRPRPGTPHPGHAGAVRSTRSWRHEPHGAHRRGSSPVRSVSLGAALAGLGIVLAPVLIPLAVRRRVRGGGSCRQVMLLVVPIVYATSPLLVIAYSHGRERSLPLAGPAVLSLGGTRGDRRRTDCGRSDVRGGRFRRKVRALPRRRRHRVARRLETSRATSRTSDAAAQSGLCHHSDTHDDARRPPLRPHPAPSGLGDHRVSARSLRSLWDGRT